MASSTRTYPRELAAATTAALKAGHAAITTGVRMQTQLIIQFLNFESIVGLDRAGSRASREIDSLLSGFTKRYIVSWLQSYILCNRTTDNGTERRERQRGL